MYKNQVIECTPGEYIELTMKGAFGGGTVATQNTDEPDVKDRDYFSLNPFKRRMPDVVAVYGCEVPQDWPTCTSQDTFPRYAGGTWPPEDMSTHATLTPGVSVAVTGAIPGKEEQSNVAKLVDDGKEEDK